MVTSLSSFGGEAGQNKVASSPPHTLPPRSDSVGVVVADAAALAPGGARDRVGEGAASNGAVPDDNQLELEFKAWWPACPRKEGRAAAKKEFFAARRRGVPFETLMDGMRRFAAAKANVEQRYIKLPANWLKEECWGDDPQPPQPKAPKRERVSKGKANPKANGKTEPVEPIEPVEPDDDDDDEFTPEEIAKEAGFPIGTCVWVRHSGLKGEIVGAEISDDYSYRLTVDYRSSGGSIARGIEPVGLTLEDPFTPEQRAEMATRAAEKEAAREAERKKRDAEWQRQRLAEEGSERTLARFPIGSHVDSIYRGDRVHGEVLEVCPGGGEIRVAWGRWPGDTDDVVSIDYLVRS
jgi:hypothetical protein